MMLLKKKKLLQDNSVSCLSDIRGREEKEIRELLLDERSYLKVKCANPSVIF